MPEPARRQAEPISCRRCADRSDQSRLERQSGAARARGRRRYRSGYRRRVLPCGKRRRGAPATRGGCCMDDERGRATGGAEGDGCGALPGSAGSRVCSTLPPNSASDGSSCPASCRRSRNRWPRAHGSLHASRGRRRHPHANTRLSISAVPFLRGRPRPRRVWRTGCPVRACRWVAEHSSPRAPG